MHQVPNSRIEATDGKYSFKYWSEGAGVSIFQNVLTVLSLTVVFLVILFVILAWKYPWVILFIPITVIVYFVFYFITVSVLDGMAKDKSTQHLFYPPGQMLPAYKHMYPKSSDDRHESLEITEDVEFTQPQFLVQGKVTKKNKK